MTTREEIFSEPWKMVQGGSGNCGFLVIVQHMIRTHNPFLGVLESFLHYTPPAGTPTEKKFRPQDMTSRMARSMQKRKFWNFPSPLSEDNTKPEDHWEKHYDWYLITALMVYYKKTVSTKLFHQGKLFSQMIKPNWTYGESLRPKAFEEGKSFDELREIYEGSYKSGSYALDIAGMLACLEVCNIGTEGDLRDWRVNCFDRIGLEILAKAFSKDVVQDAKSTDCKERAHDEWIEEASEKLKCLKVNQGAMMAIKFLPLVEAPQMPEIYEPEAAPFNHWIYILCVLDENNIKTYEKWLYGGKRTLHLDSFTFGTRVSDAKRIMWLPKFIIPLKK